MSEPLRLRVHVSEPFDFERENESSELFGTTLDHDDEDNQDDEWLVTLEQGFTFHDEPYTDVLVSPRYVGETLGRVFDSIVGFPVRIAHRTEEGWHFAMTGMISLAPPPQAAPDAEEDQK